MRAKALLQRQEHQHNGPKCPPTPLPPSWLGLWTVQFRRCASRDRGGGFGRNGGDRRTRGVGRRARDPGSPPVCAPPLFFEADVVVVVVVMVLLFRVLYGYPSVHCALFSIESPTARIGAVLGTWKSYGAVRCGFRIL